ncbi:RNA polymerase sigma factor [Pararhodobacter sp. CCB-MM2]|uniref:RNA polymerase sigma factor n=1 Tax=Pararhodobacter sp. CCB-MM2 TaxID=1786003 RepID=UPI000836C02C|nr:sigma-70 family RNA polymerase sigma factor [Pararhodobacter sp. CCB-MM2]
MPDAEKLRALIAYHAAGARLGRTRDLSALVALCDARLLAHARRLSDDTETARDIAQEAWIAVARALPGLRDEGAFLAFALRIVTRQAAREVKRRQRRRVADGVWVETRPEAEPPSEGHHDLDAALAALPAPQRVTLALFAIDGLSVAEVAQVLDIPPGTVKTRLMQARARIRAHLNGGSDVQS